MAGVLALALKPTGLYNKIMSGVGEVVNGVDMGFTVAGGAPEQQRVIAKIVEDEPGN